MLRRALLTTNNENQLPWFLTKPSTLDVYRNKSASYVVLDFEASGRVGPVHPDADLVLACWTVVTPVSRTNKYHWGDEYSMQELLEDIKKAQFLVAQNAKYELQWLRRCGLELRDVLVWCTYLAQWVLDGNQSLPRSLAALAERHNTPRKMDLIAKLWDTGIDTKDIPKSWLLEYCQRDVETTHAIFLKQRKQVYELSLQHLVLQRCLTCACLADIEFNGMTLDPQRVEEELARVEQGLREWGDKLRELSGGINLASTKQLGVFLYETLGFSVPKDHKGKPMKTDSGGYPTAAPVLAKLVPTNDIQAEFLSAYKQYNKLDSLLTKNLNFFAGVCRHNGCTFRAVFNQGITQTHRLSSSGIPHLFPGAKKSSSVQFQNLPREYKKLFWSGDEDFLLGEADGSQLEFRVAADLGGDEVAYEMIKSKGDVHTDTAKVFVDWNATHPDNPHPDFVGKDYKTGRQSAKAQTFKPLYGGNGAHPAEREYCEFFREKYKQIAETQRNWALSVLNHKQLRTPYGMLFYWPDTKMERSGHITNSTSIYNYPVITSGFKQKCLSNNSVNSGKVLVG